MVHCTTRADLFQYILVVYQIVATLVCTKESVSPFARIQDLSHLLHYSHSFTLVANFLLSASYISGCFEVIMKHGEKIQY